MRPRERASGNPNTAVSVPRKGPTGSRLPRGCLGDDATPLSPPQDAGTASFDFPAMSLRTLPLLVLNLGGEMLYIVDQRLRAQSIPGDKARQGQGAAGRGSRGRRKGPGSAGPMPLPAGAPGPPSRSALGGGPGLLFLPPPRVDPRLKLLLAFIQS